MAIVTTDGMDYVAKRKEKIRERMGRHLRHMGSAEKAQLKDLLDEVVR